jgi:hypothetical protein
VRRREFITLLGGTAVAWPFFAYAQQGERMRYVGMLMGESESESLSAKVAIFADPTRMWCCAPAMHRSWRRLKVRSRRCRSECGEQKVIDQHGCFSDRNRGGFMRGERRAHLETKRFHRPGAPTDPIRASGAAGSREAG